MEQNKARAGAGNAQSWLILLIISTAYIAVTTNIQGFKAMLPQVEEEFGISGAQAGFYSSFYFLSATLIALYSGKIVDRLGAKKGLIYGVATVGVMIVLHSWAPFFGIILGLAFFTGVGFSVITPSINKGVLAAVDPGKRALSMGLTHSGAGIGALLGTSLLPFLGEILGWRTALLCAGVFALFISLFILKFYRGSGEEVNGVSEDSSSDISNSSNSNPSSLKQDLLVLLKDRYLLSICISGIIFGITISSITAHFTLFLNQDLNYSPALAGMGLFSFHLGGIVGQPGWGMVNDRWQGSDRRKGLFILGIFSSIMALVFGIVVSGMGVSYQLILLFSMLLGLFVVGIPSLYFTAVSEQVSSDKTGVATSLALIFTRSGVIFFPPLFGYLSDLTGDYTLSWLLLGAALLFLSLSFFYLTGKHRQRTT